MTSLAERLEAARVKTAQEENARKHKDVNNAHTAAESFITEVGLVLDDFNTTIDTARDNNDAAAIRSAQADTTTKLEKILAAQAAKTAPAAPPAAATPKVTTPEETARKDREEKEKEQKDGTPSDPPSTEPSKEKSSGGVKAAAKSAGTWLKNHSL